jgi:hypothetical protein
VRVAAAIWFVGLVACIPAQKDLGAPDAAAPDAPAPPDAQLCFGTGIVQLCLASAPTDPPPISMTPLNTDTSPQCASLTHGDNYCVIAATTFSIQTTLRATGSRPLVLLATDSITIGPAGSVDVGSHAGPTPELGAGHDPLSSCDPPDFPPTTANNTSGGGAGGSFASIGGFGGNGASTGSSHGGFGGSSTSSVEISKLRGGCSGQRGAGGAGGAGGHGGGAVFLIAGNKIEVKGPVNAGGEGGKGGGVKAATASTPASGGGGGGGGAGGMIGFDAPVIIISMDPLIHADGGGGGEAASSATAGHSGADSYLQLAAAPGGSDENSNGGDGGAGSLGGLGLGGAKDGLPGDGVSVLGSGGGGGGGAGVIVVRGNVNFGKNVSPAPTSLP